MITTDYFKDLDFWFYTVGVNVRPADTRNKRVSQAWSTEQNSAMTSEEYEEMKKAGDFIRGAAIVTGKVWRGNNVGLYLNGVDFDNLKAIQEICSYNGKTSTVEELAESTLVEQHSDDNTKLHLYVYSRHPFKNKGSDAGKTWFDKDTMPAIEVKGTKSLMFCTPSMHKGGHRYQFLKQRVPDISDNFEQIINDILEKYDIPYLDKDDKKFKEAQKKHDVTKTVTEGSRHNEPKPLSNVAFVCVLLYNCFICFNGPFAWI